MSTFTVWPDGLDDQAMTIEAPDMPTALDNAARRAGFIDYADLAQEMGGGWEGLNIRELEDRT